MTYTVKGNTLFDANIVGYFSNVTVTGGGALIIQRGYQGTLNGYSLGGTQPNPAGSAPSNIIEKYSFTTDGNATDVGDLPYNYVGGSGQSSSTEGFHSGGAGGAIGGPSSYVNDILKFPFAAGGNATDIANISVARTLTTGHSSLTFGYVSGGFNPNLNPSPFGGSWEFDIIEKFPFSASFATTTDVGDLTETDYGQTGHSSKTHGYASKGGIKSLNSIERFSFATDSNSVLMSASLFTNCGTTGISSLNYGYHASGADYSTPTGTLLNVISKFPFSSDTNNTDVGDLTQARNQGTQGGTSSVSHGYVAGGYDGSPIPSNGAYVDTIDKFPFATDSNATDVGNLTVRRGDNSNAQV